MKKSTVLREKHDKATETLQELINSENPDPDKIRAASKEVREAASQYTGQLTAEQAEELAAKTAQNDPHFNDVVKQGAVTDVVKAATSHTETRGATRELQDDLGLDSNQVPLCLLAESSDVTYVNVVTKNGVEKRAVYPGGVEKRAVTPAPATTGINQNEILPVVFPRSQTAFMSVATPIVPVGEQTYPYISTGAAAGTPAKDTGQGETTGAFTVVNAEPGRIQAAIKIGREDRAQFARMEESVRMNLSDALMDKLDQQVISGLESGGTGSDKSTGVVTFATGVAGIYDQLDGTYADNIMQAAVLMGKDTYSKFASLIPNNSNTSALDIIDSRTMGVNISPHVGAVNTKKQNTLVRLGSRQDCVAPIWEGVTLITDEVTEASKGNIILTAIMLFSFKVIRSAGIKVVNFTVS